MRNVSIIIRKDVRSRIYLMYLNIAQNGIFFASLYSLHPTLMIIRKPTLSA